MIDYVEWDKTWHGSKRLGETSYAEVLLLSQWVPLAKSAEKQTAWSSQVRWHFFNLSFTALPGNLPMFFLKITPAAPRIDKCSTIAPLGA